MGIALLQPAFLANEVCSLTPNFPPLGAQAGGPPFPSKARSFSFLLSSSHRSASQDLPSLLPICWETEGRDKRFGVKGQGARASPTGGQRGDSSLSWDTCPCPAPGFCFLRARGDRMRVHASLHRQPPANLNCASWCRKKGSYRPPRARSPYKMDPCRSSRASGSL